MSAREARRLDGRVSFDKLRMRAPAMVKEKERILCRALRPHPK